VTRNLPCDKHFWHILRHDKKNQEDENSRNAMSLALALHTEQEELDQIFSQPKVAALIHENPGRTA
jgi:hypothetical protein